MQAMDAVSYLKSPVQGRSSLTASGYDNMTTTGGGGAMMVMRHRWLYFDGMLLVILNIYHSIDTNWLYYDDADGAADNEG